jgi:hypothetical protein
MRHCRGRWTAGWRTSKRCIRAAAPASNSGLERVAAVKARLGQREFAR